MKEIYLAGGCYWGVQKYCDNIRGVISTEVGFANGRVDNPYYALVKKGDTGFAETVRVVYGDTLPLRALLRLFFRIIDPTVLDRQGHDVGNQYRTGVYFKDPADETIIRKELARLAESYSLPIVTECAPLKSFYTAEEYHQKYLDKNPGGYCHVPLSAIEWVKGVDPSDYAQ
ncbi:MAG: peptide-methionine (S)-S-oxide reductase MsrA [Oscillospiraceae bacterium]|nr:peptide-methionine (S)-S-oxide reductase MsrA [Oscillospiraceae bacterium]